MSIGKHQSAAAKSIIWLTPPKILQALGPFDLDPCAVSLPRPWPTAAHHITAEEDGLAHEWFGRVWMNPPYSRPALDQFMQRMADHNHGTALLFARTETQTFFETIWRRASACLFIEGRLFFHYPDGTPAAANGGAPSVLAAYGNDDMEILASCDIAGQFVPLRLPRSVVVQALQPSWVALIARWLAEQNGPVEVAEIYRAFARHPKTRNNPNWRAKIRQSLQRGAGRNVEHGVWAAA